MKKTTRKSNRKATTQDNPLAGRNLRLASKGATLSEDAIKVIENSMVLDLRVHQPGFRKKVDSDDIDAGEGVDKDLIHVSKDLIDKKALTELNRAKGAITRWLWLQEVPMPNRMLRGGCYLIPLDLVEKVDEEVSKFIDNRNDLLDVLIDRYDELVDDARERLKERFNARDYPSPKQLRDAFAVDANWRPSMNLPAQLEKVNREIFERQKLKITAAWDDAAADVPRALAEAFQQTMIYAIDRLETDTETGKPNTFRDTFVPKINEFLSTFEARNLTNVAELNKFANLARKVMDGVSNQDLREDMSTRDRVLKEFQRVKAALDKEIVAPKRRQFSLTKKASAAA